MCPLSQPLCNAKIRTSASISLCICCSMRCVFAVSGPPNYRSKCNGDHPSGHDSDGTLCSRPRLSRLPANGRRPSSHSHRSHYFNPCILPLQDSSATSALLLPLSSSSSPRRTKSEIRAASSSFSQPNEVPPLIPCPPCGDKVVTFVSRAGECFYKCIRKHPYMPQRSIAAHPSGVLQHRSNRQRQFVDGSSCTPPAAHTASKPVQHPGEIQAAHARAVAAHAAGEPSQHRTAMLLH
nr:uncharacterized protein LOC120962982 [Aegilops tauschii subsp. strangulata]